MNRLSWSLLFETLFLISSIVAQETYNLEIIWQNASPDSVFYFGRCIASGDVNGDSFSDIMIVGDSVLDLTNPDSAYRGVCWVYFGGANIDTIPDIRLNNLQKFIFRSLISTDINSDGFSDVCCGATNNAGGYGAVLIFLGGNPMDSTCDYVLHGTQAGSCFGCDLSSGDVNGDSYDDLIVGAYGAAPMPGGYDMGQVYIYFGGPDFNTSPDVILNGGHEGQREGFGTTVGSGADVNGDGYDDVIVGAPNFGVSFWGEGRIYIYYGGDPMDTSYDVAMTGEFPNLNLGWTPTVTLLKTEFEYDMAVFGSGFWPYGFPRIGPGKVYVLFGGNPMDSITDIWMIGRTETTSLGRRVSKAGFVNQTNSEAIISGAPEEGSYFGAAYLWLSGNLLDTIPDAWIKGVQLGDGIGWGVATAGDVGGDGRDEIMVCNSASDFTQKRVWVCKYTGSGIEEERLLPTANRIPLEIKQNPARSMVRVRCPWFVKEIKIYDIAGKIVKIFDVDKTPKSGQFEMKWDLRDNNQRKVANGIYFIEVTINAESGKRNAELKEIRKITVVK